MKTLEQVPREQIEKTLSELSTKQSDTGFGICKFSREQVKEAWGHGVINDAAYIWLAVNFMRSEDQSDFTLDVGEFCDIWVYEFEAGKNKRLKPNTVRKAISTWQSKGLVSIPQEPIQMELLF